MRLRFNDEQIKKLSDFASNFSMIFFGSAIIPAFSRIEIINPFVVLLNLAIGFIFLAESLLLLKGK